MSAGLATIERARCGSEAVLKLLRAHPRVGSVELGGDDLEFVQNGWERRVGTGRPDWEIAGLVEAVDNNPMVCADRFSVPDAASTLALIALTPLVRADLLVEEPAIMVNVEADAAVVAAFLAKESWTGGIAMDGSPIDLAGAASAMIVAAVAIDDFGGIRAAYEETFGRSFYVREADEWDVRNVVGTPKALYNLRLAADSPNGLLTVRVMADLNGKCGAAQMVHAMNVMAGLEESLGVAATSYPD